MPSRTARELRITADEFVREKWTRLPASAVVEPCCTGPTVMTPVRAGRERTARPAERRRRDERGSSCRAGCAGRLTGRKRRGPRRRVVCDKVNVKTDDGSRFPEWGGGFARLGCAYSSSSSKSGVKLGSRSCSRARARRA